MERRVGLLGGTFDPPHLGHLIVAECARVELDLDEVRLVVAGDPWMKAPNATAAERAALVEIAVQGSDGLVADLTEVQRTGPTHSIDTVEQLSQQEPDVAWTLLIGADLVDQLDQWHRHEDLRAAVDIVVMSRPDAPTLVDSGLRHLATPLIGISSSDVRERYRTRRATRHLVPIPVDRHIRDLGMYGAHDG